MAPCPRDADLNYGSCRKGEKSSKHWELPGEDLGTGTRRSKKHLNGGIYCISTFVPHSNWGLKSTKFDDLLRER
jgi:hypothetical protein